MKEIKKLIEVRNIITIWKSCESEKEREYIPISANMLKPFFSCWHSLRLGIECEATTSKSETGTQLIAKD